MSSKSSKVGLIANFGLGQTDIFKGFSIISLGLQLPLVRVVNYKVLGR